MSATPEALARQLREQQYLLLSNLLDPEECRANGDRILGFRSIFYDEQGYASDENKRRVRKTSLSPGKLRGALPDVVRFQDKVIDKVGSLGLVSLGWGNSDPVVPRRSIGLSVQPEGGYGMHRDDLDFVEAVVLVGLKSSREFTIVPAPERAIGLKPYANLPPPVIVDEGDVLLIDAYSRAWHSTYNPTDQVGVLMAIYQKHSHAL